MTDTGNLEQFRGSIPTNYFRHSQGVVLVYDLTDPTSLYDLEDWMRDAYNKVPEDVAINYILIGNKLDRINNGIESHDDERCFAERHNIPEALQFKIAASEESTESLRAIFQTIALSIHTTQESETHTITETVTLVEEEAESTSERKGCFSC